MARARTTRPRTRAGGRRPARAARATKPGAIPRRIFAHASPHSVGGVSMFAAQDQIHSGTVANFASDREVTSRAVNRLRDAGFEILQVSDFTINIAGSQRVFERAFKTKIVTKELPAIKEFARKDTATFLDSEDSELLGLISTSGTGFEDVLEGVALEQKRYPMVPSSFAPTVSYWHLDVPADVSLGDNADRAHRSGITGAGIKVAMPDSGHYSHPYFANRGLRVAPVVLGPGAANPLDDEIGHGTGESANMFAVAPDAQLLPVKMSFVNTIGAFNAAVGLNPDIITCSWGSSIQYPPLSAADQALAAAIAAAVAAGIVVVFSAGNGHFGFPGQHPDVISAGGTFMQSDESLTASNYASGFMSNIYPGRRVPDLCGLVGMLPKAIYIMLPLQAGDQIDVGNAGGTWPNGDQTANNDGWAAFSGTSAAAPQLAGAAALIKQSCPGLTPAQIRDILMQTARDVTTGNCNPATGGWPATVGPDLATGNGLLDAYKAVLVAKLRCFPILPIRPILPILPIQPVQPVVPIRPIQPIVPVQPVRPIQPIRPIIPPQPIVGPVVPIRPVGPPPPVLPAGESAEGAQPAGQAEAAGQPLTTEDVKSLEEMVMKDQIRLGQ